jgi:3-hydroxyisobutyrate dehydrogenase
MAGTRNTPVAFLGWGRMGGPMACRLMAAGSALTVFDISAAACDAAAEAGAAIAANPAAAARSADVVVTMLPDDRAVRAAAEGADGILSALKPGHLWLEMSSSLPALTRELGSKASAAGADLLDAPVTGGVPKAVSGELTAIAAGSTRALERAHETLTYLAARIYHVGLEPGMGDLVKTINNLLSAANLTIAAEGVAMGLRGGIDPKVLMDVLNAGTGQSNATSWKIPQYVLTERFDSGFTIGQYLKDLEIAGRVEQSQGLALDLAERTRTTWRELAAECASSDHTEVVPMVIKRTGLQNS